MPIYEFYCRNCHTIFNFFSRIVNTSKIPRCPACRKQLVKQVSMFAMGGHGDDNDEFGDLPIDEARMEQAMESLAGEAEGIDENDPRQAAALMRKFSDMTGMDFGGSMEEALQRMEAGEDPEAIEEEMGDMIDGEDPFVAAGRKARRFVRPPKRDETLYDM